MADDHGFAFAVRGRALVLYARFVFPSISIPVRYNLLHYSLSLLAGL